MIVTEICRETKREHGGVGMGRRGIAYLSETVYPFRGDMQKNQCGRSPRSGNAFRSTKPKCEWLCTLRFFMCRVFAEKSSITGNTVGKICVKRAILRSGSMSRYNRLCGEKIPLVFQQAVNDFEANQPYLAHHVKSMPFEYSSCRFSMIHSRH